MKNGSPQVLSVNISVARTLNWRGRSITTGIFKEPVDQPVVVSGDHLEGDEQADRAVHGGDDKAVYAYSIEDYRWWSCRLHRQLPPGTFGENLTMQGIGVSDAVVGERWRVGTAVLEVTQPRLPCYKLGMKMEDTQFVRTFSEGRRPGAYLRIVEPGIIGAGDSVAVLTRPIHGVTVRDVTEILAVDRGRAAELRDLPGLAAGLRVWAQTAHLPDDATSPTA